MKRTRMRTLVAIATLAVGTTLASAPAVAGFEFLFESAKVSGDQQLFLHLAVGDSGIPRQVIEPVLPRFRSVNDDLPVALFLARTSGRPLAKIVAFRSDGMSWSAIFLNVGVPVETLFVGLDRDPGPPYGKAWGYWKKHGRGARFSDREIVSLVGLQVGHRITGRPTYEIARSGAAGRSLEVYVADTHGRPWKGHGPGGDGPPGHDKGNGKGHAKTKS